MVLLTYIIYLNWELLFFLPFQLETSNLLDKGIFKITEFNIEIILLISILMFVIFSFKFEIPQIKPRPEFEILIGLGLFALILMVLSNDFLIFFLGLELYNFTIYILILKKDTFNTRRISILYLILNSIISGIILIGFLLFYLNTGSFSFESFLLMSKFPFLDSSFYWGLFLILLSFLFKLGAIPFFSGLLDYILLLIKLF